jgi:hypothetical protein
MISYIPLTTTLSLKGEKVLHMPVILTKVGQALRLSCHIDPGD